MSELTNQSKQYSWSDMAYKYCESQFVTIEEYERHVQRYISSSKSSTSFIKDATCASGNDVLRIDHYLLPSTFHTCHICTESFRTSSQLQFHSLKHPPGRTSRCRFCGIPLNKQTDVISHEKYCFKNKWRSIDSVSLTNITYGGQMLDNTSEEIVTVNNLQERYSSIEPSKTTQEPVSVLNCLHCNHKCKTHPQAIIHFLQTHYTMNKNVLARPSSGHFVTRLPRDPLVRYRDDQLFYCDLCGHKDRLLSDLTAHIITHMKIPFFCEICKTGCSTKDGYKWHMRKHCENRFSCQRCGDAFETVTELESHRLVEHGKGNSHRSKSILYPCHKCGKFITQYRMDQHLRLAHKEEARGEPYLCKICGATYLTKSYFFNHMREHKGLKRLTCGVCNNLFMSEESLESHKLTHPAVPRPYKCRYCDATYRKHHHRKKHENTNHIRNYAKKCPDCGKRFLDRQKLKEHSVVHTKIKRFKCNICDMKFTQQASLGRHKKIHSEDKKHECTECGMKFVQKYSLTRHLLVHTGEKPHKCLKCPEAFRQVFMLTQHVRKHHSNGE